MALQRTTPHRPARPSRPGSRAGSAARGVRLLIGRSRGGLTTKIHAASTATGGRWPRSSRVGSATTGPCPPACWPTSVFYGSVPDVRAPGPPRSSPTARTPRASLVGCSLPAGSRRWSRRRRTRSPPVNARAPSAGGCPTWTRPPTRASSKVERHFNLAKQGRGLATRYDKLAITCRAAYLLCACIAWTRA